MVLLAWRGLLRPNTPTRCNVISCHRTLSRRKKIPPACGSSGSLFAGTRCLGNQTDGARIASTGCGAAHAAQPSTEFAPRGATFDRNQKKHPQQVGAVRLFQQGPAPHQPLLRSKEKRLASFRRTAPTCYETCTCKCSMRRDWCIHRCTSYE